MDIPKLVGPQDKGTHYLERAVPDVDMAVKAAGGDQLEFFHECDTVDAVQMGLLLHEDEFNELVGLSFFFEVHVCQESFLRSTERRLEAFFVKFTFCILLGFNESFDAPFMKVSHLIARVDD